MKSTKFVWLSILIIFVPTVKLETEESSGDYVPEESETVEVTNEAMEEDSDGDAVVTAEDSSNMVKPENRDKCDKCLKMSFRYRHDNFCSKCLSNNLINEEEQTKLDDIIRCKKCRKTKFSTRHALFCAQTCPSSSPPETMTTTMAPATTTVFINDYYNTYNHAKLNAETFVAMSKEEKRRMKYKKREERRKERERRRQQKEKKVIQAPELGPLGNLLKSIIVANTFV